MSMNAKYRVLGVMSGTSLDGVDFAICSFKRSNNWEFKIERAKTIKYDEYWKKTLANLHIKKNTFIKKTGLGWSRDGKTYSRKFFIS